MKVVHNILNGSEELNGSDSTIGSTVQFEERELAMVA